MKPLGLIFKKDVLPIKITGEKAGHGKDIGVKIGWVLKSINRVSIEGNSDWQEVDTIMHAETNKLPGGLRLDFSSESGNDIITKWFFHHPLGLKYKLDETPIKVTEVHGPGIVVGVQAGWILKAIGEIVPGKDVDPVKDVEGMSFVDVTTYLKTQTHKLPPAITLTWDTGDGNEETVIATKKPLGLVFNQSLPIKITSEKDGHGKDIGIQVGWVLKNINGVDVLNSNSFADVQKIMHEQVNLL